jgi:hypothetical protein
MFGYYILEGKTPVKVSDVIEWGTWFETANRTIFFSEIGRFHVSTVFLGIDHSCGGVAPVLFETAIIIHPGDALLTSFKDIEIRIVCRYSTYDEAEQGHYEAVDSILDQLNREKEIDREVDSLLKEVNLPKL